MGRDEESGALELTFGLELVYELDKLKNLNHWKSVLLYYHI